MPCFSRLDQDCSDEVTVSTPMFRGAGHNVGRMSHGRMIVESERTAIEDGSKGAFERRLVVPAPSMPPKVSNKDDEPGKDLSTTKAASKPSDMPSINGVKKTTSETVKAVARPMPAQEEKVSPDAIETIPAPSTTPATATKKGSGDSTKVESGAADTTVKKKMLWW